MSIIPRKNETEAAMAILESEIPLLDGEGNPVVDDSGAPVLVPAYDDAASRAKALVRAIGTELAKREAYLIIPPDGALAWGPYYTSAQAVRAWEKEIGPATNGAARIARSFPWNPPQEAERAGLCVCGHAPEQHVVKNLRGGKTSAPAECGICEVKKGDNPCPQYQRRTA